MRPLLSAIEPGEIAWVYSYTDGGQLSVVNGPEDTATMRAFCDPSWLRVVGYNGRLTRAHVVAVYRRLTRILGPIGRQQDEKQRVLLIIHLKARSRRSAPWKSSFSCSNGSDNAARRPIST